MGRNGNFQLQIYQNERYIITNEFGDTYLRSTMGNAFEKDNQYHKIYLTWNQGLPVAAFERSSHDVMLEHL